MTMQTTPREHRFPTAGPSNARPKAQTTKGFPVAGPPRRETEQDTASTTPRSPR